MTLFQLVLITFALLPQPPITRRAITTFYKHRYFNHTDFFLIEIPI